MNIWKKIPLPLKILVPGALAVFAIATLKPKPAPSGDDDSAPALVKAQIQQAQPQQTVLSVKTQGTVAPKRQIDIVAQVTGQVQSVEPVFVNGGFFDKGQLLIKIEDRDFQAAYLASKARVAGAQQALAEERGRARQARREWRDLGNTEANDLFLRKPQIAAAQANVASAQAELEQAKLNLARTEISVPFDGRIRETLVNIGQYVSQGTRIATVYDTSVAEIRLPLSDRQVALVDLPLGYSASSPEEGPEVEIAGIIGGKRYTWQGHITRTDASIDVNSRMYFAVAEVANPFKPEQTQDSNTSPLVVGLFVEATIAGKQLNDVVVLPRDAVFKRNKVYVLNAENAIEQREVNVLHKTRESVWIQSELPYETAIVLEKQGLLTPGTVIEPLTSNGEEAIATAPKQESTDEDNSDNQEQ